MHMNPASNHTTHYSSLHHLLCKADSWQFISPNNSKAQPCLPLFVGYWYISLKCHMFNFIRQYLEPKHAFLSVFVIGILILYAVIYFVICPPSPWKVTLSAINCNTATQIRCYLVCQFLSFEEKNIYFNRKLPYKLICDSKIGVWN